MIDWLIDLIGDFFDSGADVVADIGADVADAATTIDWSSVIDGVISTGLIVAGVIVVASITEDTIRGQMRNRPELLNKGVESAVVKDFIQQNGYTEITLAALNKQNQQVGTFKMKSSRVEDIELGDKIFLRA